MVYIYSPSRKKTHVFAKIRTRVPDHILDGQKTDALNRSVMLHVFSNFRPILLIINFETSTTKLNNKLIEECKKFDYNVDGIKMALSCKFIFWNGSHLPVLSRDVCNWS